MKIAIVLPPGSPFSAKHPNSVETGVYTPAAHSRHPGFMVLLYDAGTLDTGDFATTAVGLSGGRNAYASSALPRVVYARPDWRAVPVTNAWYVHASRADGSVAPLGRFGNRVVSPRNQAPSVICEMLLLAVIAVIASIYDGVFQLAAAEADAAGAVVLARQVQ